MLKCCLDSLLLENHYNLHIIYSYQNPLTGSLCSSRCKTMYWISCQDILTLLFSHLFYFTSVKQFQVRWLCSATLFNMRLDYSIFFLHLVTGKQACDKINRISFSTLSLFFSSSFYFWPCCMRRRILVPQPRIEARAACSGSLNHWSSREVPLSLLADSVI